MRVSQGGHDVPLEKLITRFPRTLANLKAALQALPRVSRQLSGVVNAWKPMRSNPNRFPRSTTLQTRACAVFL